MNSPAREQAEGSALREPSSCPYRAPKHSQGSGGVLDHLSLLVVQSRAAHHLPLNRHFVPLLDLGRKNLARACDDFGGFDLGGPSTPVSQAGGSQSVSSRRRIDTEEKRWKSRSSVRIVSAPCSKQTATICASGTVFPRALASLTTSLRISQYRGPGVRSCTLLL